MNTKSLFTVRYILLDLKARLAGLVDDPGLDAQVLLGHVMGKNRAWLLANPEAELTQFELESLNEGIDMLLSGVPLPYVIGHWEFYGLDYNLTQDVLIPRPETELLVQSALTWLRDHPDRRRAVDLGTGSGCIAVTLCFHVRRLINYAGDISESALLVAQTNSKKHFVDQQVCLFQGDLGSCIGKPVDLVCANLPYIPTTTLKTLDVYGREPDRALDGGEDGLKVIRSMLNDAPRLLAPGGLLLAEIEERQGLAAAELARQAFPGAQVEIHQDLAGKDRMISVMCSD